MAGLGGTPEGLAEGEDMLTTQEVECAAGPVAAAEALRGQPYACFLDSSLAGPRGRWSFLCSRPFLVMTVNRGRVWIDGRDGGSDPFAALASLLKEYRLPLGGREPPFACGAAGYLSYDLGRYVEEIPSSAVEDLPQPDMCLAFYDCVLAFDTAGGRAWLSCLASGRDKAEDLRRRLRSVSSSPVRSAARRFDPAARVDWSRVDCNLTHPDYLQAVERVKDYIAAGDVYQINLSQRFSAPLEGDPWSLYKVLREVNPSPFGCFLDFPDLVLASASPERLLCLDAATRTVETRPIKGTRPRGRTRAEDRRLAAELASSEKDRAENVMILDMERSDLGKVCEYGSVHVPSLREIEQHPNVFQMVSTARGTLASDKGPAELLAACFPGGSITGAPKVRAMQIIEELEPTRRGIYTGSVGYIDFRGNMDFNIVIRSFVLRDGRAYFHAGGGVVADSDPEKEYQETLDKVAGLVRALQQVRASSRDSGTHSEAALLAPGTRHLTPEGGCRG